MAAAGGAAGAAAAGGAAGAAVAGGTVPRADSASTRSEPAQDAEQEVVQEAASSTRVWIVGCWPVHITERCVKLLISTWRRALGRRSISVVVREECFCKWHRAIGGQRLRFVCTHLRRGLACWSATR
eukprot:3695363-Prymnesium_polylepis.1